MSLFITFLVAQLLTFLPTIVSIELLLKFDQDIHFEIAPNPYILCVEYSF